MICFTPFSYLLGNQITGDSSVNAYINALKQGCRCVELDCWDGGTVTFQALILKKIKKIKIVQSYFTDNNEPIIYHGYTLTSKILFKDVMQDAILPYAFYGTDYPLILSIENHCSIEQQDVLADHMKNILGDFLYTDPVDFDK